MSNKHLNLVFTSSRSSGVARNILLSIADRANENGDAFCGATDICRRSNASRSAVFRGIKWLQDHGELVVLEDKGPRACNRYSIRLVSDQDYSDAPSSVKSGLHPSQNDTSSSAKSGRGGSVKMRPKPSLENPPGNPPEREEPLSLDDAVAMFEPIFPDKPVRRSLSRMKDKFRRLLTPSECRKWLENEKEGKREKRESRFSWDDGGRSEVAKSHDPTGEVGGAYAMPTGTTAGNNLPSVIAPVATPAPVELQDNWTNKGYSATGQNLTPGIVAVNTDAFPLGTIFKDENGHAYLAADIHGNDNEGVVDIYEPPSVYGKGDQPKLTAISKIPRKNIPKTVAGVRELLAKYGKVPPGESAVDSLRGRA